MAAIDQRRQLNSRRPPERADRIHRRPDGTAGEEDVIDEDDDAVVDRKRDLRLTHHRRVADARQVVAVERDIDRAERKIDAFVRAYGLANPRGERVATRADADDREKGKIALALDDLVRDPRDGPPDIVRTEQRGRLALPSRPRRTGR